MRRTKTQIFRVSETAQGAWAVTRPGATEMKVFESRSDAMKAAQQSVRERGGVLEVKGADGRESRRFTLGRTAMTKLNEVEGVVLGSAGKQAFEDFDRRDLSPPQRRIALRKAVPALAAGTKGAVSRRAAPAKPAKS